jgi:sugar/nucleoside kinase (ribokinase family)
MARALARRHDVVALKRGAAGALVRGGEEEVVLPAPRTMVVDPTGAGDAFCAGFLACWAGGADLRECADAGIATAARAIVKPGGGP